MDLVLVTGAGASRELGVDGPMPLMADWSRALIDVLESRMPGIAGAMDLSPELDGQQFEATLGAWLQWRASRPLSAKFERFGGPQPNSTTHDFVLHRQREDERADAVLTALNETLQQLFGGPQLTTATPSRHTECSWMASRPTGWSL